MANIQPRRNKDGSIISYSIRVYKGRDPVTGKQLKPYTMTWEVPKGWSEKTAEKAARTQAIIFEKECREGVTSDNRQTFSEYAQYVIDTKVRQGILKPRTEHHYRVLLTRINETIGHMKLKDIRPQHINQLYEHLSKSGKRSAIKARAKVDLRALIKEKGMSLADICKHENVSIHYNTIIHAFNGKNITLQSANEIATALDTSHEKLFSFITDNTPLSNRTIRDYHQFVSTIFADAVKEMLIPYNPASKARSPKVGERTPNYLQSEDVTRIIKALETEPVKWRAMIHMFLVTGCRMGEIIGLKWDKINWASGQILIDRALLYTPVIGLYEDTPKTRSSVRIINVPQEMMYILKEYYEWQQERKKRLGDKWQDSGFVFTNMEGGGINPGTVSGWLKRFSQKRGLPYLNAHAFRHTQASILFFNGVDAISISKRLGHARVSTTTDIYSHIMKESEALIGECVADVIYRLKG